MPGPSIATRNIDPDGSLKVVDESPTNPFFDHALAEVTDTPPGSIGESFKKDWIPDPSEGSLIGVTEKWSPRFKHSVTRALLVDVQTAVQRILNAVNPNAATNMSELATALTSSAVQIRRLIKPTTYKYLQTWNWKFVNQGRSAVNVGIRPTIVALAANTERMTWKVHATSTLRAGKTQIIKSVPREAMTVDQKIDITEFSDIAIVGPSTIRQSVGIEITFGGYGPELDAVVGRLDSVVSWVVDQLNELWRQFNQAIGGQPAPSPGSPTSPTPPGAPPSGGATPPAGTTPPTGGPTVPPSLPPGTPQDHAEQQMLQQAKGLVRRQIDQAKAMIDAVAPHIGFVQLQESSFQVYVEATDDDKGREDLYFTLLEEERKAERHVLEMEQLTLENEEIRAMLHPFEERYETVATTDEVRLIAAELKSVGARLEGLEIGPKEDESE